MHTSRSWPGKLEDNTMIERSKRIKDNAVGKLTNELAILPSSQILAARVAKLSIESSEYRGLAKKYITITQVIQQKIEQLAATNDKLTDLNNWLDSTINTPVDNEAKNKELYASDTLLSLMAAHIRLLPSGHDFFAEGTSTILEAGLRSGLALNYACSNGNCGKCKAKVISGEVNKTSDHDFVISDTDKANGHILMCCNEAVTDITIEALEAGSSADIPQQQITAKVKKVDTSHDDVALIHAKTPRTMRLRFLAGQYVSLGGNNGIPTTDISVSSCPCDDMNIHFQVPNIPGDAFSEYVFSNLKSGDTLDIVGPNGDFVLNENSHHSLTFIAWHTGFAPIRSLVEHAMALDTAESISFIWITEKDSDRYLDNLCRSWNDAFDNFNYTSVVANLNTDAPEEVVNNIIDNIDEISEQDIYVAGNAALLDSCSAILKEKQFNPKQLKLDLISHA